MCSAPSGAPTRRGQPAVVLLHVLTHVSHGEAQVQRGERPLGHSARARGEAMRDRKQRRGDEQRAHDARSGTPPSPSRHRSPVESLIGSGKILPGTFDSPKSSTRQFQPCRSRWTWSQHLPSENMALGPHTVGRKLLWSIALPGLIVALLGAGTSGARPAGRCRTQRIARRSPWRSSSPPPSRYRRRITHIRTARWRRCSSRIHA